MNENLPEHPAAASIAPDDDEYVLTMERQLSHPVDRVWAALTQVDDVVHWAPYRPDRDLTAVGAVSLAHNEDSTEGSTEDSTEESTEEEPGQVLQVEPPHLLVVRWGDQLLTYRLSATPSGTLLHFTHRFDDRNSAPDYSAGWHVCWSALQLLLDGSTPPPVHGENAEDHGWGELREQYAVLLGQQGSDR